MESGFFNSVGGDRKYNAEDISRYFEHIISSGLYKAIGGCMKVSAAGGMELAVAPGAGLIDSHWFRLESGTTVTISAANAALPRIDSVVVRLDMSESVRAIHLAVVEGTPASEPVATAPTDAENVKELVIAHVYVGAAVSEIIDANITDTRADADICGWAQSQIDAPLLTAVSTTYTATVNNTSVIDIDVSAYNATTDILNVYADGLRLTPEVDYTIDPDALTITLANPVAKGTVIAVEALKPIIPDDLPTAAETMEQVLSEVSGYNARITENEDAIAAMVNGIPIAPATSTDGVAYTATIASVSELYNGLIITVIPDMDSTSTAITLNVNGLGAIPVRLPLSYNNAIMVQPTTESYYGEGRPLTLQFDSEYATTGVWKTLGKQRPDANTMYGVVKLENGGLGASDQLNACKNIGADSVVQGTAIPSGADLDTYTTPGVYYSVSGTNSATLVNTPYTGTGFRMVVFNTVSANHIIQEIKCNSAAVRTYRRIGSIVDGVWDFAAGWYQVLQVTAGSNFCEGIGAVKKSGGTMTGALTVPVFNMQRNDGSNYTLQSFFGANKTTRSGAIQFNATDSVRRFSFVQYHQDQDGGSALYGDNYNLPVATSGLSANKQYDILTTKNVVYSASEPSSPTTGMIWLCPVD